MTSLDPPQGGDANAKDKETSASVQSPELPNDSAGSAVTVTALSRPETDSAPILQRAAGGRFAKGNTEGRTTGLYAARVSAAQIAERQAFETQSLADDGEDVPARRRARHSYRARVHVQVMALSDALEHFGLFDKRGRLRVAWLQRLEGLIAVAQRLDAGLGDERQTRSVTAALPISEWVRRHQREQDAPTTTTSASAPIAPQRVPQAVIEHVREDDLDERGVQAERTKGTGDE